MHLKEIQIKEHDFYIQDIRFSVPLCFVRPGVPLPFVINKHTHTQHKTYYRATVIKTVSHWHKARHRDQ